MITSKCFIINSIYADANKNNINIKCMLGGYESLKQLILKTDAPLRANFRRIKQGGYPSRSVDVKISAECHHFS